MELFEIFFEKRDGLFDGDEKNYLQHNPSRTKNFKKLKNISLSSIINL